MPGARAARHGADRYIGAARTTGLHIYPLLVAADTPQALAATASAVSPGFAAVCLSHTHPAYAAAVRSALADTRTPVVDTTSHAHAVAIAAATLNALRHKGVRLPEARVVLAGASRCADLAGVLLTLGIRSLTFDETGTPGEHHGQDADVIVDLIGQPATKDGPPVLRACPQDLPPLQTTNRHPHPLHALPALLITAARARRSVARLVLYVGSESGCCSAWRAPGFAGG